MHAGDFTVYLIDDDPGVLKALDCLVRACGHNVKSFLSSREFLATHDPLIPGCVVVDLAMPDMDGLELQEMMLGDGEKRPIVFLTGNGDTPAGVRAMKAGAVDFLTKPVKRLELLAALTRAIEIDAQLRQERADLQSVNGSAHAIDAPRTAGVPIHGCRPSQ